MAVVFAGNIPLLSPMLINQSQNILLLPWLRKFKSRWWCGCCCGWCVALKIFQSADSFSLSISHTKHGLIPASQQWWGSDEGRPTKRNLPNGLQRKPKGDWLVTGFSFNWTGNVISFRLLFIFQYFNPFVDFIYKNLNPGQSN